MVKLTPTERLEGLKSQPQLSNAADAISRSLLKYDQFLQITSLGESELTRRFEDKSKATEYMRTAAEFGDLMYETLEHIGNKSRFHRLLIV